MNYVCKYVHELSIMFTGKCRHRSELDSWPTSASDRSPQNSGAVPLDVESCRFTTISAVWTKCAAHCATLPQGQCLCPRNTEDDCETVNGCTWLKGICIHELEKIYNAQNKKLSIPGTFTITIFRHVTVLFIHILSIVNIYFLRNKLYES